MRRPAALALIAATALAGCGFGAGDELSGAGVQLRVTRDFGREVVSEIRERPIREDETVMRFLRSENDVDASQGGRFVDAIDGVEATGSDGQRDWFYFVNGVLADQGAAEYELSAGDRVQWDYRDWSETPDVRAIVGAFPEPFVHGVEGKRFPVRVECEDAAGTSCKAVKDTLRAVDVPATGSSLGAPGTHGVIRVIVATWDAARDLPTARQIENGPSKSGVFARFDADGERLELLDEHGDVVRTDGGGTGIVAALRPTDDEIAWVVTGVDDAAVERAAAALSERDLRGAFAIAVSSRGVERLPL